MIIQVIRPKDDWGSWKNYAAGLTIVSSSVHLENITFPNVSAEIIAPSCIYVEIKIIFSYNPFTMNNILVETISLQNWADNVIWHLTTAWNLIRQRSNVTVRCVSGDQKIRTIASNISEILYCLKCNTLFYNVVQTPAFAWKKSSELVEVNNTCHDHCPYQASCID